MDKKILLVIESLSLGGAESATVNLANTLADKLPSIALAYGEGQLSGSLSPKVTRYKLPTLKLTSVLRVIASLYRAIKDFSPAVIHCQNAVHCAFVRLVCGVRKGKRPRIILTHHSIRTERIPNFISGVIFNLVADEIVVIAEHRKRALLGLGVAASKVFSIPNMLDLSKWQYPLSHDAHAAYKKKAGVPNNCFVLLSAGRLVPSKRVDVFIRVISELRKSVPNVFGVILGDGPERASLESLAAELGVDSDISFPGVQSDVVPYYLASDIYVFPSEYEVLPMSLIEALASGLPIVCSRIPGNDEIVSDGSTGFLVEDSILEYVSKVRKLLADTSLRTRFSIAARKAAMRYSSERIIAQVTELYDYQ